ncbi:MAG: outer membrane lipoprotein-sorting protein, partial [bacterium]
GITNISGTLSTIFLPRGSYTLRLTTRDRANNVAADSISFIITTPMPTPAEILQKVAENFGKIEDMKGTMTSWGNVGTKTFPEVEEIFMMKKPDKVKVISPAKEEIIIINGELMYYINPTFGTLTMQINEYSNIKPSQLNFYYYSTEFQEKHEIEIKNHNDNFYILEVIPKEPNWNYEKLILEIDYQKGIDIKTEFYIKATETATLGMEIEVKKSQLIDDIWIPTETVKKVFLEEEIVAESNMQLHDIQINTGIKDEEFIIH